MKCERKLCLKWWRFWREVNGEENRVGEKKRVLALSMIKESIRLLLLLTTTEEISLPLLFIQACRCRGRRTYRRGKNPRKTVTKSLSFDRFSEARQINLITSEINRFLANENLSNGIDICLRKNSSKLGARHVHSSSVKLWMFLFFLSFPFLSLFSFQQNNIEERVIPSRKLCSTAMVVSTWRKISSQYFWRRQNRYENSSVSKHRNVE